jgi:hypothetical protein
MLTVMGDRPGRRNAKSLPPTTEAKSNAAVAGATVGTAEELAPSWLESPDPRRRMLGKFLRFGLWSYVAALWLLALDQIFHWGIFGPTLP